MKIIDLFLILALSLISYKIYQQSVYVDILLAIAFLYAAIRKRNDVNVLTLCICGSGYKLTMAAIGTGAYAMNGLVYLPLTAFIHFVFMFIVAMRPLIFSNIRPFKSRPGFAIVKADRAIIFILILMIIFDVLLFIEHGIRRVSAWHFDNIRFLYDSYPNVQIAFTIVTLLVLLGILTIDDND